MEVLCIVALIPENKTFLPFKVLQISHALSRALYSGFNVDANPGNAYG